MPLTTPPRIEIEVVEDRTAEVAPGRGFLRVRHLVLQNRYADGTTSEKYFYDLVERAAIDAVAIVLEAEVGGEPAICLRTQLRPPLAFRPEYAVPVESEGDAVLWEVPAGLVEADERGEEGLRACAARETHEEVGLELSPDAFGRLGPSIPLSPGVIGEKIHYLVARVDPSQRGVPLEDGSPVEERAVVRFVPIADALAAIREGHVADAKTEIAIRRLAELRGVR